MSEITVRNSSFIQSMHNNVQCIESLDPDDKGTSRQYWFTASMLANIFDISFKTVKNNVDFLVKWGEVTDCKNLHTVQTQNNVGAVNDTTLYDLQVFNKLAMQLRTDAAMEIRSKFSDILVQVETTGQYNAKDMPKSLPEALRAYADAIEAKEQAAKECERQRLIAEEAIKRRAQIGTKREATAMNTASRLSKENAKLKDELTDTIEKLDQVNVDNDILKTQLEIAKSSMLTNKRVCEMLRDRFEISLADSTLKSRTSKALQSIANEFSENVIYDKQFVEGVLRKVPYYTQRTADILMQRLAYDCAYLRQF